MRSSNVSALRKAWLLIFASNGFVVSAFTDKPFDPGQATVSIAELQHPLSGKAKSILLKAQAALQAGKFPECLQDLDQAMKIPSAIPYAYGLRGAAYLKSGDVAKAIPDLQQVVQVLPLAGNYSNLGYAYLMSGERELGEEQVRRAIESPNAPLQARYLMGLLLLDRKSQTDEACDDLDRARNLMPKVHMALAVCYARDGMEDASNREIRQLLGTARASMFEFWKTWVIAVAAEADPAASLGLRPHSQPTARQ